LAKECYQRYAAECIYCLTYDLSQGKIETGQTCSHREMRSIIFFE